MSKKSINQRALLTVLIAAREATGLTKRQLSAKLGRRQNFVSQTERGERPLRVEELHEYGEGVGLSSIEIVARMEAERALYLTAEAAAAAHRAHAHARKKARKPRKKG